MRRSNEPATSRLARASVRHISSAVRQAVWQDVLYGSDTSGGSDAWLIWSTCGEAKGSLDSSLRNRDCSKQVANENPDAVAQQREGETLRLPRTGTNS